MKLIQIQVKLEHKEYFWMSKKSRLKFFENTMQYSSYSDSIIYKKKKNDRERRFPLEFRWYFSKISKEGKKEENEAWERARVTSV